MLPVISRKRGSASSAAASAWLRVSFHRMQGRSTSSRVVEQRRAMHVAGQADALDGGEFLRMRLAFSPSSASSVARDPVGRVLLRPAGMRPRHVERRRRPSRRRAGRASISSALTPDVPRSMPEIHDRPPDGGSDSRGAAYAWLPIRRSAPRFLPPEAYSPKPRPSATVKRPVGRIFFETRKNSANLLLSDLSARGRPAPAARLTKELRQRAFRPRHGAFGRKRRRKRAVAGAERRLDQRQVDDVALRMAAAEAVRDAADRARAASPRSRIVALAERLDGARHRLADLAGEGGVVVACRPSPRPAPPAAARAGSSSPAPTKAIMACTSLKA